MCFGAEKWRGAVQGITIHPLECESPKMHRKWVKEEVGGLGRSLIFGQEGRICFGYFRIAHHPLGIVNLACYCCVHGTACVSLLRWSLVVWCGRMPRAFECAEGGKSR